MRDGKESGKKQSMKDRRKESRGARKSLLILKSLMTKSLPKPFLDEWLNDSFVASNPSGENMNRFSANDLRNLVTEVVSAYQAEKIINGYWKAPK